MQKQDMGWTDEELRAVYEALCDGEGRDASDAEVGDFLRWAQRALTDAAFVQHVLGGRFLVRRVDGEWSFKMRPGATYPPFDN